jgi:hypothetical protein
MTGFFITVLTHNIPVTVEDSGLIVLKNFNSRAASLDLK